MTHQIFNLPPQQPLTAAGRVLPGAKVSFFVTLTSTPADVYTTSALNVAHTQPVEADLGGRFATIYLDPDVVYKATVTDANDALLYTVDPVNDQVLSAATIGQYLYPQTAAEISAGFTPEDYTYPEGHVLRGGGDEAGLIAVAAFCSESGVPIVGATTTVTLTDTLVLNCIGDLSMMTVEGDSSAVSPLVLVGTTSGNPTQLDGILKLPKVSNSAKPGSGWAGQQTGIEFANLYESEIYVPYVFGFDVGLDSGGYNSGYSYNTVRLGQIVRNKIGVRLKPKSGTGWANQNQYIGGRIWIPSSEGTAISGARYIQLASDDTENSWPNTNTFIGTSVEDDGAEYQVEICGNNNLFLNCRWEATVSNVLLTGHASNVNTYENLIIGGYNASQIVFTTSGVVRYTSVLNSRISSMGGSDAVLNMNNRTSNSSPLIQGFESSIAYLNKTAAATDWSLRLSATGIQGKASGDGSAQVDINFPNGLGQFRRLILTSAAFSQAAGVVCMGNTTQTTVGAAGGASALPATPTGYLRFFIGTSEFVLPYYARA